MTGFFFLEIMSVVVSVRLRKLSFLSALNIVQKCGRSMVRTCHWKSFRFVVCAGLRKSLLISELYINSKLWKIYGTYWALKFIYRVYQIKDNDFFSEFCHKRNSWWRSFFLNIVNPYISDSFYKCDWLVDVDRRNGNISAILWRFWYMLSFCKLIPE